MNLPSNLEESDYLSIFNKVSEIMVDEVKGENKDSFLKFIRSQCAIKNKDSELRYYNYMLAQEACNFLEEYYFVKYFDNENYPNRVLEVEAFVDSFKKELSK